ncbi:MAG: hypothetical protein V4683_12845 [Bacteroidota bacterium]
MKNLKGISQMKISRSFLLLFFVSFIWSCKDKCTQIQTYRTTKPKQISLKELRGGISNGSSVSLEKPGKIYIKDNYLFINEIKKGIHVIDNSNPSSPKFISFINIPGNIDMAVVDNIMYADSYTDIVVIDITNPAKIGELNRVEKVFLNGTADGVTWYLDEQNKQIVDYEWVTRTDTIEVICEGGVYPQIYYRGGGIFYESAFADKSALSSSSGSQSGTSAPGASGKGGSMARFGIVNDYLYAVSNSELIPFNISNLAKPQILPKVNLNWGIETIFPYKDKLFIGSTTGMHIYDNKDPAKPKWLSTYNHFKACDPVVVYDKYAYVTLRSNNGFGRCGVVNSNQLDLIDIEDPEYPTLVKSFDMEGPAGLGIDYPNLFICEGDKGMKVFSMANPLEIDKNKLAEFKNFEAYDVIPLNKKLMVIGKDGLYQYDYSDPKNMKLLSSIKSVVK